MFVSTLLLLLVACASAAPFGLNLEKNVTTSGISAGAYVAVQYAVAYSNEVTGLGVFAGGPYYCAQNTLLKAATECMVTGLFTPVSSLVADTQSFAANGKIDPVANLKNTKVYLYSGQRDTTVATAVVQDLEAQFAALGVSSANFATQYAVDAGHGVPTLDYGVACASTGSPYLNSCNYDGVGAVFNHIYSGLNARTTTLPPNSNWKTLATYDYLPSGWTDFGASLGTEAVLYAPTACQNGAKCRLHIAWHGCSQGQGFIGEVFYKHAGYWQWAEANNIVVLFPQAASNPLLSNPVGCFDWWGYTDGNYAFKNSVQMTTVKNMVQHLGAQM